MYSCLHYWLHSNHLHLSKLIVDIVLLDEIDQFLGFRHKVQRGRRHHLIPNSVVKVSIRLISQGIFLPLLFLETVQFGFALPVPDLAIRLGKDLTNSLVVDFFDLHQLICGHANDHPAGLIEAADP